MSVPKHPTVRGVRAETFKSLRKRLKLSRLAFARELGIHRVSVTAYETGARPIPRVVAKAAAAVAFNLPAME